MEDEKSVKCSTGNRTRYVVLVLATLCLSSVLGNILTFNFTIICMSSSTEGISAGNLSNAAVVSAANVATLRSKPQNDTEMLLAMNATEEGERSNSSKVFDEGSPAEFNYSASTKSLLF
uniref:Uncharacterized protein n=1 Tax=Plectus sambesii TaxID=2011161 RepID=A0A914WKS5_9BILA